MPITTCHPNVCNRVCHEEENDAESPSRTQPHRPLHAAGILQQPRRRPREAFPNAHDEDWIFRVQSLQKSARAHTLISL